jgi:hypothetical protein
MIVSCYNDVTESQDLVRSCCHTVTYARYANDNQDGVSYLVILIVCGQEDNYILLYLFRTSRACI